MSRWNVLMLLALLGCGLLLVTSQYRTRQLSIEMEQALGQSRELDVRENQLRIQIAERSRESRIDQQARQDLQMITVTPDRVMPARELLK